MNQEIPNFLITYIGNDNFEITLSDGKKKLSTRYTKLMVRYTYFQEQQPQIGWNITSKQLIDDYYPKIQLDMSKGLT